MSDARDVSKLWWAVPAAAVLLLTMLAVLLGGPPPKQAAGTSYDPAPEGFRAAFVLLDELDYPVFRSKRPGGGTARMVLFPTESKDDADKLASWVRAGKAVVLADADGDFAGRLGISLTVSQTDPGAEDAAGPEGVARLAGGTRFVAWQGQPGRVWATAGGRPFVTVHDYGYGEVWLVNRPEFLKNRLIGEADNGVLLCRMAEEVLNRLPQGTLGFDEFYHGLRERPGALQLLFEPPVLWVTLQGILLLGLLLWHYVPRFGTLRPIPDARRRSKQEFLDAMASLLERKGDYEEAYRTARASWLRDLEREFGLPPGTPPEEVAREAAGRRQADAARLLRLLQQESLPRAGPAAFVQALNELESARQEFLDGRRDR